MVKNKRIKIDPLILSILISPLKRKKDDAMRARSLFFLNLFFIQFHIINALGGVFEGI